MPLRIGPAVRARADRGNYVREQDLQAARTTASLGRVLGLAHEEALTPQTRDVCLLRRNAVGSAN